MSMVGLFVHGDNHFVVRGPLPDRDSALELATFWSLIQIGATIPASLARWRISTREFREDLQWAVVIPGDSETSPAVGALLRELAIRGVPIHYADRDIW